MTDNRCVRKNFNKNGGVLCKECFYRDRTIEDLRLELKAAKVKIAYLEKKRSKISKKDVDKEPHTPSSWRRFKTNSSEENRLKKGGAKLGHKGFGRRSANTDSPEIIAYPQKCPCCDVGLVMRRTKKRTVVDTKKLEAERNLLNVKSGKCPQCQKVYRGMVAVLPKLLYGNRLLSQAAVMHYLHGVPIGRLLKIFGPNVTQGGLINSFHNLGRICETAHLDLVNCFRKDTVRNADETGWRNDGRSGYAWVFSSPSTTVFEHRDNRSSRVPLEIFGETALDGVLIVDRYAAYNKINVKTQYCYAHLLREVATLEKEFADNLEIKRFVKRMCSLMGEAMNLQKLKVTMEQYCNVAHGIKKMILREVSYPYEHLGIRRIQEIFLKNRNKMFHWADNPNIPADNNRAEREIRPTVVARKTSFGSQSDAGAKTRSRITSVLFTAKKRLPGKSLENWFFEALNKIAEKPETKIYDLLPATP